MKKIVLYTSYLLFVLITNLSIAQTKLFEQNFSSSSVLSNYIHATAPDGTQFTDMIATGGINTIGIVGDKLVFDKTATAGSMRFVRNVAFTGSPTSLYVQFKISANSSSASPSGAQSGFYIGGNPPSLNLGNDATVPALSEVFCRIGFDFPPASVPNTFRLRNRATGVQSADLTGEKTITIVCNDTGQAFSYVKPDLSGSATLATGKSDVWVDNTLFLDEYSSTGGKLRQMKFLWESSTSVGTINFDDFLIRDVSGILPVELADFSAKKDNQQVQLSWKTLSESQNSHFVLSRSTNAQVYENIATIDGQGTKSNGWQYSFTDQSPQKGINYYRLSQYDTNGQQQNFRPVSVEILPEVTLWPNPSDGQSCYLNTLDVSNLSLTNLAGQSIPIKTIVQAQGLQIYPTQALVKGLYIINWQQDATLKHALWSVY